MIQALFHPQINPERFCAFSVDTKAAHEDGCSHTFSVTHSSIDQPLSSAMPLFSCSHAQARQSGKHSYLSAVCQSSFFLPVETGSRNNRNTRLSFTFATKTSLFLSNHDHQILE